MHGTIFSIQHFSIHDGPGVRTTVFLKGCPLRCVWCHNPEGLWYEKEIMWDAKNCVACKNCVAACPSGAIEFVTDDTSGKGEKLVYYREKCRHCFACINACYFSALQEKGEDRSPEELAEELLKDKIFFEESGGGVTFSGGEPLAQADFVAATAKILKEHDIHVALDTSGQAGFSSLEKVLPYTDLFLYDWKHNDPILLYEYTKADYDLIEENLKKLSAKGALIDLRIPVIGGYNLTEQFVDKTRALLTEVKVRNIHLLPYHKHGNHKYEKLWKDLKSADFYTPSEEELVEMEKKLRNYGNVLIGG